MTLFIARRYNDSNGNSRGPSPSPGVSNQRPRPVSLTVPSLLGKDSSSLCHGSAGSLVEAVSLCVCVCVCEGWRILSNWSINTPFLLY